MVSLSSGLMTNIANFASRLTGSYEISFDDGPFWDSVLEIEDNLFEIDILETKNQLRVYISDLVNHNDSTWNFQKYLCICAKRLRQIGGTIPSTYGPANMVLIIRLMLGIIIENKGLDVEKYVELPRSSQDVMSQRKMGFPLEAGESVIESWIFALLDTLVIQLKHESWNKDEYYAFVLELMKILCMISAMQCVQLEAQGQEDQLSDALGENPFLNAMLENADVMRLLSVGLLKQWVQAPIGPSGLHLFDKGAVMVGHQSVVTSAARSLLWIPSHALWFLRSKKRHNRGGFSDSPVGMAAEFLFLLLYYYCPRNSAPNTFKEAVNAMKDPDGVAIKSLEFDVDEMHGNGVPFSTLFESVGDRMLHNESTTLVLYALLHGNKDFFEYCMARTDVDILLVPILKLLYTIEHRPINQVYLLLIMLLILSQESTYVDNVFRITLTDVSFYRQRNLKDVQLGSLTVVILLQVSKYNAYCLKDLYLHTNALATLANLAPNTVALNTYACQRLLNTLDSLEKMLGKLARKKEEDLKEQDIAACDLEIQLCSDFVNIILEFINAILVHNLTTNPNLVYCLLHKRDSLDRIMKNGQYGDLMHNIELVTKYFGGKIEEAVKQRKLTALTTESIQDIISTNLRGWRKDHLKLGADLKFTYEEDSSHSDFFLPFIWNIISASPLMSWRIDI